VVNSTPRPLYRWEKGQVLLEHEAGWTPGPVWKGAISLVPPTGFDPRTAYFRARGRVSFLALVLHHRIYTARSANRNNSLLNRPVVNVQHDVTAHSTAFWIRFTPFHKNRTVKYCPQISISVFCFPGVTTHCGCIFHSPVAGFCFLVFEVS